MITPWLFGFESNPHSLRDFRCYFNCSCSLSPSLFSPITSLAYEISRPWIVNIFYYTVATELLYSLSSTQGVYSLSSTQGEGVYSSLNPALWENVTSKSSTSGLLILSISSGSSLSTITDRSYLFFFFRSCLSTCLASMVNSKIEPWPTIELALMDPPSYSQIFLQM